MSTLNILSLILPDVAKMFIVSPSIYNFLLLQISCFLLYRMDFQIFLFLFSFPFFPRNLLVSLQEIVKRWSGLVDPLSLFVLRDGIVRPPSKLNKYSTLQAPTQLV